MCRSNVHGQGRPPRNHAPTSERKAAPAAIGGDEMQAELARPQNLHRRQNAGRTSRWPRSVAGAHARR